MLPELPIPTRSPIRLTGLEPELDVLLGRASVDGPLVIDAGAGIESGGYWQRDRLGDTCAALAATTAHRGQPRLARRAPAAREERAARLAGSMTCARATASRPAWSVYCTDR